MSSRTRFSRVRGEATVGSYGGGEEEVATGRGGTLRRRGGGGGGGGETQGPMSWDPHVVRETGSSAIPAPAHQRYAVPSRQKSVSFGRPPMKLRKPVPPAGRVNGTVGGCE